MGTLWTAFVELIITMLTLLHNWVGSYGLAIILFTVVVKGLTLPLTMKQVRSSKAMQDLQPKLKEIQEKYKNDREKQSAEMMNLYREHGVHPASGCLPLLVQMPLWIALYNALFELANRGELVDGFLWLPTLAEPKSFESITALGLEAWPYLILPLLTVVTQVIVQKMMTPAPAPAADGKKKDDDPTAAVMGQMNTIMPLMFGFFALSVPSGLALYWVTSNVFAIFQQALVTGPESIPYIGVYLKRDEDRSVSTLVRQEPSLAKPSSNGHKSGGVTETPASRDIQKEVTHGTTASRKRKKRRG